MGVNLVEAKDVIKDAVVAVFEFAKSIERGGVIAHTDMERLAGCQRYKDYWQTFLSKFRKKLLAERGIALLPVNGVGYRFAEHAEQVTECPRRRQRRICRQATMGKKELEVLPVEELSLHQQKLRAMTMDHLAHTRRVAMRVAREQKREQERTTDIPIRKMGDAV